MPSAKSVFLFLSALLLWHHSSGFAPTAPSRSSCPTFARPLLDTRRHNLLDTFGSMFKNFGKKASASHILIGPKSMGQAEARERLLEMKEEIGDDPEKFAQWATLYSSCPSSSKGGALGSFGPGMMVKNFDKVVFEEEVGIVHGPISTQFGEHLILITERTGED